MKQPNKSAELAKLFDAVVAFQQDQSDSMADSVMQDQKKMCAILWPAETLHTCKQAITYVERFAQT